MFLIKNFMKLSLCLLLIFKNSHAIDKKNTKNLNPIKLITKKFVFIIQSMDKNK